MQKTIISSKDSSSTVPSTIIKDTKSLTNPKGIADALKNYFTMWLLVFNFL